MSVLSSLSQYNEAVNGDLGHLVRTARSYEDGSFSQKFAIFRKLMIPIQGDKDIYNIYIARGKIDPMTYKGPTVVSGPNGAAQQAILVKYLVPAAGAIGLAELISSAFK